MQASTRMNLAVAAVAVGLVLAGTVFAANPPGVGQPSQSCGGEGATLAPAGFSTDGFANAETHYAGSDGTPSQLHAHSTHAVSQYDVACFQYTSNH